MANSLLVDAMLGLATQELLNSVITQKFQDVRPAVQLFAGRAKEGNALIHAEKDFWKPGEMKISSNPNVPQKPRLSELQADA